MDTLSGVRPSLESPDARRQLRMNGTGEGGGPIPEERPVAQSFGRDRAVPTPRAEHRAPPARTRVSKFACSASQLLRFAESATVPQIEIHAMPAPAAAARDTRRASCYGGLDGRANAFSWLRQRARRRARGKLKHFAAFSSIQPGSGGAQGGCRRGYNFTGGPIDRACQATMRLRRWRDHRWVAPERARGPGYQDLGLRCDPDPAVACGRGDSGQRRRPRGAVADPQLYRRLISTRRRDRCGDRRP
jgi:hypothetical protein